MARSWRDIMSYQDFQQIAGTKSGFGKHLVIGKEAKSLQAVADKIKLYHQLSKSDANKISIRRTLLADVAEAAEAWFVASKTDKTTAAARPVGRSNAFDERTLPLQRIMLTLTRRSLRKRQYLQQLATYLAGAMSPAQLIQYAHRPQEHVDGQMSMVVRMEVEDFAHRDGYEGHAEMAQAFDAWAEDTHSNNIPFFLWFENHPICTSPDKSDSMINSVGAIEYVGEGSTPSVHSKMRVLDLFTAPPISEIDLTSDRSAINVCDTYTAGFHAGSDKAINPANKFGRGIACFVWSPNDDVFLAAHCSGKFHHSSLLAGGNVKCAGMMGVKQGLVTEMSNNSGHYRPKPDEFRTFVMWLQQKGAVAKDCYLRITSAGGLVYQGSISNYARVGQRGLSPNTR